MLSNPQKIYALARLDLDLSLDDRMGPRSFGAI